MFLHDSSAERSASHLSGVASSVVTSNHSIRATARANAVRIFLRVSPMFQRPERNVAEVLAHGRHSRGNVAAVLTNGGREPAPCGVECSGAESSESRVLPDWHHCTLANLHAPCAPGSAAVTPGNPA